MTSVVGMTGVVATEIRRVVSGAAVHVDFAVPVIACGIGCFVQQFIVAVRREGSFGKRSPHAVANTAIAVLIDVGCVAVIHSRIRGLVSRAVGRVAMTDCAVKGKGCCGVVAEETTDSLSAYAVKAFSVAKGASFLDIARRVMKHVVRAGPFGRMGELGAVTIFAAVAVDADVEAWIASGSARIAVALLANRQISLGDGTVNRSAAKGAVQEVISRPAGVTTLAVITRRKATGRFSSAMQVGTVAGDAVGDSPPCLVVTILPVYGMGLIVPWRGGIHIRASCCCNGGQEQKNQKVSMFHFYLLLCLLTVAVDAGFSCFRIAVAAKTGGRVYTSVYPVPRQVVAPVLHLPIGLGLIFQRRFEFHSA